MQVLIVDDDPDLQDAICETLEGGGLSALSSQLSAVRRFSITDN